MSAGHLYAQDAFRSSRLQNVFVLNVLNTQMLWLGSAYALQDLWDEQASKPWVGWILFLGLIGIGAALLFGQAIAIRRAKKPWFRHRLWPTLEPGHILKPGDELPERRRAHA